MDVLDQNIAIMLEAKRGIDCEQAAMCGVVSRPNAIGFQYLDNGSSKFVKWRGKGKKFWIEPSGQKLQLWNLDSLRGASPEMIIICEGELDALSWRTVGAHHVVSVPNGAPAQPGEGEIIPTDDDAFAYLWDGDELIPELQSAKRIILATDGDKPGRILAQELAIRLGVERCWLVEYPDGCKDTNDVLVKHGHEAVSSLLETAKSMWETELISVSDIPKNPLSVAHSTGWTGLDKHLSITPPELMIVTGQPNAGKSQWAWALGCQMARIHDWKVAVIQFEDGIDRIRDTLTRYARSWAQQIADPAEFVRNRFLMPIPDNGTDERAPRS